MRLFCLTLLGPPGLSWARPPRIKVHRGIGARGFASGFGHGAAAGSGTTEPANYSGARGRHAGTRQRAGRLRHGTNAGGHRKHGSGGSAWGRKRGDSTRVEYRWPGLAAASVTDGRGIAKALWTLRRGDPFVGTGGRGICFRCGFGPGANFPKSKIVPKSSVTMYIIKIP